MVVRLSPSLEQRPSSLDVLASWIHRGDSSFAGRPALATRQVQGWEELTFAELDQRSAAVASWLAEQGVGPGDRTVVVGESGPDWVAAFLGILRRGAIAVPLDPKLTPAELSPILDAAKPSAFAASSLPGDVLGRLGQRTGHLGRTPVLFLEDIHGLRSSEAADEHRSIHDPAMIVWTSGTTGAPKGVTLSLANVDYVVTALLRSHGLAPGHRWLSVLPPYHMLELSCGIIGPLLAGCCVYFAGTLFPAELTQTMVQSGTNRMVVVPMLLKLMKKEMLAARPGGGDLAFYSGGASLDQETLQDLGRAGIAVYQGYGLTETSPTLSTNTPRDNRPGSVGKALPGTQLRIDVEGEILARSPGLMLGYWEDQDATEEVIDERGWFHTGDLGHIDEDGFLYVTGRMKNLIVLDSGKKVQPEEVESALASSELFAESCVVGWRSTDGRRPGTEQVCAVVVPSEALAARASHDAASLHEAAVAEVRRLTARLSGYKRPTMVKVHSGELPKTRKRSVHHGEVLRALGGSGADGRQPRP